MKKGFTLIELLAVLIILSIVSLVAAPLVTGIIDDAKEKSFKATCDEIYRSYNQYVVTNEIADDTCIVFDFSSNRNISETKYGIKYEPVAKLNLKGDLPQNGIYKICGDKRELIIDNEKYTCIRDGKRNQIIKGNILENDTTEPVLNNVTLTSTTSSIKVVVDALDEDGILEKYYYKINGEETTSQSNVKIYNNLEKNTEYEIEVVVENKSGLKSNSVIKKISTKNILNPSYSVTQTLLNDEYVLSNKITIKYDATNGLENYFKSTVDVIVEDGIVTSSCDTNTMPYGCKDLKTTLLVADTWYKTNNINPTITFKTNGVLYALTSDGLNISETSTYTVNNIETREIQNAILNDNTLITKQPTLTTTNNLAGDESGLYSSNKTNDGKITYYFRGNVDNYVMFAGYTWKIIRINEDGSVRMIMTEGINNNASYPYVTENADNYLSSYYSNSNAKKELDNWYSNNLSIYESYLSNEIYCEAARVINDTYHSAKLNNATLSLPDTYQPTFECSNDANNYGIINSKIGLITYDEVVYAGGSADKINTDYYLNLSNTRHIITMSPCGLRSSSNIYDIWFIRNWNMIYSAWKDQSGYLGATLSNDNSKYYASSLNPVINLKPTTKIVGKGTENKPYIVVN